MRNMKMVVTRLLKQAKVIGLVVFLAASSFTAVAIQPASTAQAASTWGPMWIPYNYYTQYYLDCYSRGYYLQVGDPAYFLDQYGRVTTYPINPSYVWAYCGP